MTITFEVDRVERARKRAPEHPVSKAFAGITDREAVAWSVPEGRVLKQGQCDVFAAAVHFAFAEHRPSC